MPRRSLEPRMSRAAWLPHQRCCPGLPSGIKRFILRVMDSACHHEAIDAQQRRALERIVHRPRGGRTRFCCWMMARAMRRLRSFCILMKTPFGAGSSALRRVAGMLWSGLTGGGRLHLTPAQQKALNDWLETRLCRDTGQIRALIAAELEFVIRIPAA